MSSNNSRSPSPAPKAKKRAPSPVDEPENAEITDGDDPEEQMKVLKAQMRILQKQAKLKKAKGLTEKEKPSKEKDRGKGETSEQAQDKKAKVKKEKPDRSESARERPEKSGKSLKKPPVAELIISDSESDPSPVTKTTKRAVAPEASKSKSDKTRRNVTNDDAEVAEDVQRSMASAKPKPKPVDPSKTTVLGLEYVPNLRVRGQVPAATTPPTQPEPSRKRSATALDRGDEKRRAVDALTRGDTAAEPLTAASSTTQLEARIARIEGLVEEILQNLVSLGTTAKGIERGEFEIRREFASAVNAITEEKNLTRKLLEQNHASYEGMINAMATLSNKISQSDEVNATLAQVIRPMKRERQEPINVDENPSPFDGQEAHSFESAAMEEEE